VPAPHRVYLGLGSNLGDRAANLWEAVRRLGELPGCRIGAVSHLYETSPVGPQDQPWFLNAVVRGSFSQSPLDLLHACKCIELDMGRVPSGRWGPRLIDVDILLYGRMSTDRPELTIPHREMWSRAFVLRPLLDVLQSAELRRKAERHLSTIVDQDVHLFDPAICAR